MDPDEFVGDVDDSLQCSICFRVLADPRSCHEGHTFCRTCIMRWLKDHKTCPTCKSALDESGLTNNRVVQTLIGRLASHCPNHCSALPADEAAHRSKRRASGDSSEQKEGVAGDGAGAAVGAGDVGRPASPAATGWDHTPSDTPTP